MTLRILEFRDKGFSDVESESIKLGFAFSAGTITTTAGLIIMMAISFGFLLLAPQQILGQWGFYIIGASLRAALFDNTLNLG